MNQSKIGYACMNIDTVPNVFRTCRIDNLNEERLIELIRENILVLERMIDYNIAQGNQMYRVSSSLIPFASSPLNTLDWAVFFKDDFDRIKHKIIQGNIRISCHPGQYTVINSNNKEVVRKSILELEYHAKLMNLLTDDPHANIILHVGGIYDDKEAAMARFVDVYQNDLSNDIKQRLVIENDDRLYSIEDVLLIASKTSMPVVFDNLHHECLPSLAHLSVVEILQRVLETWSGHGKAKVHYSQQAPNKRLGAHSETIDLNQFQKDYENIYSAFDVDIMLEVKDKNRSFVKVDSLLNPDRTKLEKEWARYKYLVMSFSIKDYNSLRHMFKGNPTVNPVNFYELIDHAIQRDPNIGNQINAMDHIWGYFKKKCTESEKQSYLRQREKFSEALIGSKGLNSFLNKMAVKYQADYLLDSYYFTSLL